MYIVLPKVNDSYSKLELVNIWTWLSILWKRFIYLFSGQEKIICFPSLTLLIQDWSVYIGDCTLIAIPWWHPRKAYTCLLRNGVIPSGSLIWPISHSQRKTWRSPWDILHTALQSILLILWISVELKSLHLPSGRSTSFKFFTLINIAYIHILCFSVPIVSK